MFYDPLAIALAVISANIPDFDHEFKRNHVITIIALGALVSCFLYFLGLPYYLGLVIILLGGSDKKGQAAAITKAQDAWAASKKRKLKAK